MGIGEWGIVAERGRPVKIPLTRRPAKMRGGTLSQRERVSFA